MAKQAFSEVTNSVKTMVVKTMVGGLAANADLVAKRGIDAEFITALETSLNNLNSLDNEQETLKAKLKTKTTELEAEMKAVKAMLSEAKKVVKMSVDQSGWREFGIEDSK